MSNSQIFGTKNPMMAPYSGTVTANNANAVVVANTAVTADSSILLTIKTAVGANAGGIKVVSKTAGVGFSVVGGGAADTSVYNYMIIG